MTLSKWLKWEEYYSLELGEDMEVYFESTSFFFIFAKNFDQSRKVRFHFSHFWYKVKKLDLIESNQLTINNKMNITGSEHEEELLTCVLYEETYLCLHYYLHYTTLMCVCIWSNYYLQSTKPNTYIKLPRVYR